MTPSLSVIVPVYNVEKYLAQCLDSLVSQTLKDIEIILVNDGSTDRSEEICRSYAERDIRIRLYSKPNGGLSDARNYGLERAAADVVGFVDSDDYVDEDMFSCLLNHMREHGAEIAVGGVKMVTEDREVYQVRAVEADAVYDTHEAMRELLYSKRILNSVCNKIFAKELFDGIRFPYGKLYEDEYVTYRLFDRAQNAAMTNQVFYYYRKNPQSITHVEFNERELDRVHASLQKLDFIREKYPDLENLVQQYLVYDCVMALSKMKRYDRKYNDVLAKNIRKYWKALIRSDHSMSSKLFAVTAAISPKLAVAGFRLIS